MIKFAEQEELEPKEMDERFDCFKKLLRQTERELREFQIMDTRQIDVLGIIQQAFTLGFTHHTINVETLSILDELDERIKKLESDPEKQVRVHPGKPVEESDIIDKLINGFLENYTAHESWEKDRKAIRERFIEILLEDFMGIFKAICGE